MSYDMTDLLRVEHHGDEKFVVTAYGQDYRLTGLRLDPAKSYNSYGSYEDHYSRPQPFRLVLDLYARTRARGA